LTGTTWPTTSQSNEHPDGSQVLLDGGHGRRVLLDVGGDDNGLYLIQGQAARFAPAQELTDGPGVGSPRVLVADVGGEELDEAHGMVHVGRSRYTHHLLRDLP